MSAGHPLPLPSPERPETKGSAAATSEELKLERMFISRDSASVASELAAAALALAFRDAIADADTAQIESELIILPEHISSC